jgi:hypothetical protein
MRYIFSTYQLLFALIFSITFGVAVTGCTNRPIQRASWEDQLAYTQEVAAQIDPNALLVEASANIYSSSEQSIALQNTFTFVRPSGNVIELRFLDTEMRETMSTSPDNGGGSYGLDNPQEKEEIRNSTERIRLSSFDVLQLVQAESRSYAEQYNQPFTPRMSLWIGRGLPERLGVDAVWIVVILGVNNQALHIVVDAHSGEIIARASNRFEFSELGR